MIGWKAFEFQEIFQGIFWDWLSNRTELVLIDMLIEQRLDCHQVVESKTSSGESGSNGKTSVFIFFWLKYFFIFLGF